MISGIDLNALLEYKCRNDKENPTTWKLGVIPASIMGQLSVRGKDEEGIASLIFKLLQYGIKGWDNFGGIEFKTEPKGIGGTQIVPMELIDRIPINIATELNEQILKLNRIGAEEEKNS